MKLEIEEIEVVSGVFEIVESGDSPCAREYRQRYYRNRKVYTYKYVRLSRWQREGNASPRI